ncbi:MAG TPA: hypothetical protein VMS64_29680 [Candidatus Methylomirabilis sp.]|nr:hypothetical protein [Candidatus Methylomirabilis sp.]
MCGKVFHDPNSEIAASRILAVRGPAEHSAALDGGNRYIECTGGALQEDLRAAGLSLPRGAGLGSLLVRFLSSGRGAGFFRVSADDNARVNVGLDKALEETARTAVVRAKPTVLGSSPRSTKSLSPLRIAGENAPGGGRSRAKGA